MLIYKLNILAVNKLLNSPLGVKRELPAEPITCYGLDPLDQGYATGLIILPLDYKSCRFAMLPRYPPLGVVIRWHVCISVDS